jgi:coenzyme F420-reducing hydrogenase beta subunit
MASWTLEALLASGEVDSVAAVGRTSNPDKLFDFKICRSAEEIRACGRSAYYPVEISQVIKYILQNEGRYAIIGLPCVCKAVRLAQDRFPKLKRRITHVLGLTCGHQSSKFFAEYICALGDGNPHDLREIIFRTKDLSQPASNLGITFRSGEGDTVVHKQVLWKDGIGSGYMNGYFQIPGCFYCDDVFAECADAVFMDAWLPEYVNDPKGTSLVLVREKQLFLRIQRALSEGTILCDSTPTDKVVQSQRGVVQRKRLFPLTGKCPIKRKSQNIIYLIDRLVLQQTFKISSATGEIWKKDSEHIYREIKKYLDRIVLIYKIRKMILTPVKFILKKNNR